MRYLSVLIMLLGACASIPKDYTRGALVDQILHPMPNHAGLVNSQCTHDQKTGVCSWDYVEYDLNDRPTRIRLRDAGFVCNVGGTVYRIAQEKAGLILEKYVKSGFLGLGPKKEIEVDFIPISNYQRLLDARTTCFSHFTFDYDSK